MTFSIPAPRETSSRRDRVAELRRLAETGRLAHVAATAAGPHRIALAGATFSVAWPVVFARLTRGVERRRGHAICANSVFQMAEDCLDHFYDDVEAVMDDVLTHARTPIRSLEAWIGARLNAATVDGYRRRRGQVGALQRPRLPTWLSQALAADPWLTDLATQILTWVGVPTTAGAGLWPLDAWGIRRAAISGNRLSSDPVEVAQDINAVLAVMRTHHVWYGNYVERPLGRKRPPVIGSGDAADLRPLLLTSRADLDDGHLTGLAFDALAAIAKRLRSGQPAPEAVTEVIGAVFGADFGSPVGRLPFDRGIDDVTELLRDPHRVARIVAAVLRIIADPAAVDAA